MERKKVVSVGAGFRKRSVKVMVSERKQGKMSGEGGKIARSGSTGTVDGRKYESQKYESQREGVKGDREK